MFHKKNEPIYIAVNNRRHFNSISIFCSIKIHGIIMIVIIIIMNTIIYRKLRIRIMIILQYAIF